jgi:diadenosine tetraphosphate (Ap4A) HIT family hydrolase
VLQVLKYINKNNGRIAHQEVDHVHFHIIPKDVDGGLGIIWPVKKQSHEEMAIFAKGIADKLE